MAAAARHGVRVVNTPGRNATAVAEFTIGAILSETRLIPAAMKPCARVTGAAIFTGWTAPGANSAK